MRCRYHSLARGCNSPRPAERHVQQSRVFCLSVTIAVAAAETSAERSAAMLFVIVRLVWSAHAAWRRLVGRAAAVPEAHHAPLLPGGDCQPLVACFARSAMSSLTFMRCSKAGDSGTKPVYLPSSPPVYSCGCHTHAVGPLSLARKGRRQLRHVCCAAAAAPAEAACAATVRQSLGRPAADGTAALFAHTRRRWVLGTLARGAAPDRQPRMRLPRVQPRPSTLFANLRSTPRADTPPERAARDLLAWQEDRPKKRRSSRLRSRRRLHAARAKRLRVVPRAAPAASAVRFRPPPALQPPARLCRLPRRRRAVRAAPSHAAHAWLVCVGFAAAGRGFGASAALHTPSVSLP